MGKARVVEFVDIEAPQDEVFDLVLNLERRLQLSPLWGMANVESISPDYPEAGSSYHVRVEQGDKDEYDTIITDMVPNSKFAYRLTVDRGTEVCWTVQSVAQGTRLIYLEEFDPEGYEVEDFSQAVRDIVRQWLKNIKNYSELREGRLRLALKWVLDRHFLKLRNDQRKTIVTLLFLQAIGFISFVMAAIALGIANLLGFTL